jgi:elongation factor P
MLSMNDVRKGKAIVLEGEPYLVMEANFLKKQQRRPVVRSRLKHLKTGNMREHTFMQSDKIEEADITKQKWQFLFGDGTRFTFMDQATYEQLEFTQDVVGEAARYLLEGQEVDLLLFDGAPVSVLLPIKIERKVIEAPPGVRGDTSGNLVKEVVVEGGVKLKAPLFINEGDVIRLDTRTGDYVERA